MKTVHKTIDGPASHDRHERWLWVLFGCAWCVSVYFSLIGLENTLLGRFQFRQLQTALATQWMMREGFSLAYSLPLFGPPWAVPLEFPLYQAATAWFTKLTGLPLDSAGRVVSWLFFQSSLPAAYLLLGVAGVRPRLRWITLALLVTSPIYIFYSRAFLIESLALTAGLWFLLAFCRFTAGSSWLWLPLVWLAGAVAGTVKVTSWVVFVFAAGVFVLARWSADWKLRRRETRIHFLRAIIAGIPPCIAALAWTLYAKSVRDLNPDTALLNTHFGFWSFGDIPQRLSWEYWSRTIGVWINGVSSEALLVVGLVLFVRLTGTARRIALAAAATFLSGQLIFSNLYKVHDYYFYANGLFLIAAVGIVLAEFFQDLRNPRWLAWSLVPILIALQIVAYAKEYLPSQRLDVQPAEYVAAVQQVTQPGDALVILGMDWDSAVAYYADRKALMLTAGREDDVEGLRRSLGRLDPDEVGAVMLFGHLRDNATFAGEAMSQLQLPSTPLLLSHSPHQLGIWVPRPRVAWATRRLPVRPYATMNYVQSDVRVGEEITLGRREIALRREFQGMRPLPVSATTITNFSYGKAGTELVLNAHAPSEIVFRLPAGARTLTARLGIHDGSYIDEYNRTDGADFVFVHRRPDGSEQIKAVRHVDPWVDLSDRGPQTYTVDLTSWEGGGDIVLRVTGGASGNLAYDWTYVGALEIR